MLSFLLLLLLKCFLCVPDEWTCDESWYGDDYCDCDSCGTWDIDCDNIAYVRDPYDCDVGFICALDVDTTEGICSSWTCSLDLYGDGNCDCNCGAWDIDCDVEENALNPSDCGPQEICVKSEETIVGICTVAFPRTWTCDISSFNDGEFCDCDCGSWDLDCDDSEKAANPNFCQNGEICVNIEGNGTCVHSSWMCDSSSYNDGEFCDCGCGVWDPDCNDPQKAGSPVGCEDGSICVNLGGNGSCIPRNWTCDNSSYNDGEFCDCGCGAWDIDCEDPSRASTSVIGCEVGQVCVLLEGEITNEGFCSNWTCSMEMYGDGICDCTCGTWDIDCDDLGNAINSSDCPPREICVKNETYVMGECKFELPHTWTCDESSYFDGEFCNCDCGAWDVDCVYPERAANPVGCGAEEICEEYEGNATCRTRAWYVSQDDPTGGYPCPIGTPCGFAEALGFAKDGDFILLNNGVYSTDLGIEKYIDIQITIEGETRDGVILEDGLDFNLDSGKSFTLKRLTVRNTDNSFLVIGSSNLEEVEVEEVSFESVYTPVIVVDSCSTLSIRDIEGEDFGINSNFIEISQYCDTFSVSESSFNGMRIGSIHETNTVNLLNSTFVGDASPILNEGGAFYFENGDDLYIDNCVFENFEVESKGGALYICNFDMVTIENTQFISCSAEDDGGAIHHDNGENMIIRASDFTLCTTRGGYGMGGGVFTESPKVLIEGSNFMFCSVAYQGGAVYQDYGETNITSSNFTSCYGGYYGGGLRVVDATKTMIVDSIFTDCSSEYSGGAVFKFNGDTFVTNTQFISCHTVFTGGGGYGGGIYQGFGEIRIQSSHFISCYTDYFGGGAYLEEAYVSIISSTFELCTTYDIDGDLTSDGGGLYLIGCDSLIENSDFISCSSKFGGGVYERDGVIIIRSSNFENCYAFGGAGAFYSRIGLERSVVEDTNFINCSVGGEGGAVRIWHGETRIVSSNFTNCSAGYNGGGVYLENSAGDFYRSTFTSCFAEVGGGGGIFGYVDWTEHLVLAINTTNIVQSNFINCEAKKFGGGVFQFGGTVEISGSRFEGCKVTEEGSVDDVEGFIHGGGGVKLNDNLNPVITGTSFLSCSSKWYGGGVFIEDIQDSTYSISGCEFEKCGSEEGGGGLSFIYEYGKQSDIFESLEIDTSTFKSCYSRKPYGSGVYLNGKIVYITSSSFLDCSLFGDCQEDFSRQQFYSIYSSIYVTSGTNFLSSSIYDGFGVNVVLSDTFFVSDSVFEGNITIGFENVEYITFEDSSFSSNAGFRIGDYEYQDDSLQNTFQNAVFQNCNFEDSVETPVEFLGCGSVFFYSCVFNNISNTAIDIYSVNSLFEMRSTIVSGTSSSSSSVVNIGLGLNGPSRELAAFVVNSTFEDIEVNCLGKGSALNVFGTGKLLIEGSNFVNGLFQQTGAVSIELEEVRIIDCRFENNHARHELGEGGGVFSHNMVAGFSFSISNTTFDRCSSGFRGGTIYLNGVKSLSVDHITITNSEAGKEGGGMYVKVAESGFPPSSASLSHSNFYNCRSGSVGGCAFFSNPDYSNVADFVLSDLIFDGCRQQEEEDKDGGSAIFLNAQSMDFNLIETVFHNFSTFKAQHFCDVDSENLGVGEVANIEFFNVVALDSKIYLKDVNFHSEECEFSSGNYFDNSFYESIVVADGTKGCISFSDNTLIQSNISRPMDEMENKTLLYLKAEEVILSGNLKIEGKNENGPLTSIIVSRRAVLSDFFLGRDDHAKFIVHSEGSVEFSNCSFEYHCKDLMNIQMIGKGLMLYDIDFNDCEGNIIDTTVYLSEDLSYFMTEGIVFSNVNVKNPRANETVCNMVWNTLTKSLEYICDLSIFRLVGFGSLTIDEFVFDGGTVFEEISSFESESAFFYIEDIRGGVTIRNSVFRNNIIMQEMYSVLLLSQIMATSTFYFENVVIENNFIDPSIGSSHIVSIDFPPVGTTFDCLFENCEFRNNTNEIGNGGCIFNLNGNLKFKDCTMIGNSAFLGGHVYNEGGIVSFSGSSQVLEQITYGGIVSSEDIIVTGAVHSEGGGVEVLDTSEFRDSEVSCVYVHDGYIRISPLSSFTNCHSSGSGGAINSITTTRYVSFSPVLGGSYTNCSAVGDGGAVSLRFVSASPGGLETTYDVSSSSYSSSSSIYNCSSGGNGGAFFFENINMVFICEEEEEIDSGLTYPKISFIENNASSLGGAIYSDSTALGFDPTCTSLETGERMVFFEFNNNNAKFGMNVYDTGVLQSQSSGVVPENSTTSFPDEWFCFDILNHVDDTRCFRNFENVASFPHQTITSNVEEKPFYCPPSTFDVLKSPSSVLPGEFFGISVNVTDCYGDKVDLFSIIEEFSIVIVASNQEETLLKSSVFEIPYEDHVELGTIEFEDLSLSRVPSSFGNITAGVFFGIQRKKESDFYSGKKSELILEACRIGQFRYGEDEIICSSCAKGTYSAISGENECKECPKNANCDYGIVVANEGYWSYTKDDVVVILTCANGKCLLGNNCSDGYDSEAPICGACEDGFAEWGGVCSKCTNFSFWKFVLLVLFVLFLVFQVLALHKNSQVPSSSIERIYSFFGQVYKYVLRNVYWGYLSSAFTPILAFLTSYQFPSGETAIGDESESPILAKVIFPFSYIFSQMFSCPFERGSYAVVWGDYFDPMFMVFVILVGIFICLVWKFCRCCCSIVSFCSRNGIKIIPVKKQEDSVGLLISSSDSSREESDDSSSSDLEFEIKEITKQVVGKEEEDKVVESRSSKKSSQHNISSDDDEEIPKKKVLFKKISSKDDTDSDEELEEGGVDVQKTDDDDDDIKGTSILESEEKESSDTEDNDDDDAKEESLQNSEESSEEEESDTVEDDEKEESLQNSEEDDENSKTHQKKREKEERSWRKEKEKLWAISNPFYFWTSAIRREINYRTSEDTDCVTKCTGCQCWTFSCHLLHKFLRNNNLIIPQKEENKIKKVIIEEEEEEEEKRKETLGEKFLERILLFISFPYCQCLSILKGFYSLFFKFLPYQRSLITFTIVTYQIILDNVLGFVTCMRYQDHFRNVRHSDIQCFNNFWFSSFPLVFFLPLIYCIFVPVFYLVLLFLNKRKMYKPKKSNEKTSFDERFGTLYLCYKRKYWWYEIFSFARKAFIVFMVNFTTTWTELGNFLFCFCLGGFLVFHLIIRPYRNLFDNILEGISLVCLNLLIGTRASFIFENLETLAVMAVFFTFTPVFLFLTYLKFRILFICCLKRLEILFFRKCFASCVICCCCPKYICCPCLSSGICKLRCKKRRAILEEEEEEEDDEDDEDSDSISEDDSEDSEENNNNMKNGNDSHVVSLSGSSDEDDDDDGTDDDE